MALSLQIKNLSWRHRSMARAVVYGGLTPDQLSREYGMTRGHISVILHSPIFQTECERLEAQATAEAGNVRGIATELAPLAGRIIQKRLQLATEREEPDKVDLDSAFGILKLALPAESEKHLHLHEHHHREASEMSEEELRKDVFDVIDYREE